MSPIFDTIIQKLLENTVVGFLFALVVILGYKIIQNLVNKFKGPSE